MRLFAHLVIAFFVFGDATAQDLDPRKYVNLPTGQNFLAIAYSNTVGDVNISPSLPLKDAVLTVDAGALVYVRTLDIGGKASSIDVALPYACVSGSATLEGERLSRTVCGQGDTRIRLSYNFIGAPAMELSEFVKHDKEVVVGVSLQVSIPTGKYDASRLLNIGTNRWFFKPEIGMSIPWRKWSLDFAAGARFFTANNEFFGDVRLEQDPLYNLQLHLNYDLSRRQWVSLNSNYFFGGNTDKDSVPSRNRQKNSRLGLTWSLALNATHTLKFLAHTGVATRIANDSDTFGLVWIYRWD